MSLYIVHTKYKAGTGGQLRIHVISEIDIYIILESLLLYRQHLRSDLYIQ
jgi:hypothetical protein